VRPRPPADSGALAEAFEGLVFVGVVLEDGVEVDAAEQVLDAGAQLQHLERAAVAAEFGVDAHQLADAGAIEMRHLGQVQQDVALALGKEVVQQIVERAGLVRGNLPGNVHHGHIAIAARYGAEAHERLPGRGVSLPGQYAIPPPDCKREAKRATGPRDEKDTFYVRRILSTSKEGGFDDASIPTMKFSKNPRLPRRPPTDSCSENPAMVAICCPATRILTL